MKLGDTVALVAQPIARGIDKTLGTDIQNCSGCAKRQQNLNAFGDAVWDFLWESDKPKNE